MFVPKPLFVPVFAEVPKPVNIVLFPPVLKMLLELVVDVPKPEKAKEENKNYVRSYK